MEDTKSSLTYSVDVVVDHTFMVQCVQYNVSVCYREVAKYRLFLVRAVSIHLRAQLCLRATSILATGVLCSFKENLFFFT